MMGEVGIGKLVRFVTVETSIDTLAPVGLTERRLVTKLMGGLDLYYPVPTDVGLVISGPEVPEDGGNVRLWEVLLHGKKWWFDEEHLVSMTK